MGSNKQRRKQARKRRTNFLKQFVSINYHGGVCPRVLAAALRYGEQHRDDIEVCGHRLSSGQWTNTVHSYAEDLNKAELLKSLGEEIDQHFAGQELSRPEVIIEMVKRYTSYLGVLSRMGNIKFTREDENGNFFQPWGDKVEPMTYRLLKNT